MTCGQALLCIILPPLAVLDKGCGTVLIVALLTLFGWVPGAIAALVITSQQSQQPQVIYIQNPNGQAVPSEQMLPKPQNTTSPALVFIFILLVVGFIGFKNKKEESPPSPSQTSKTQPSLPNSISSKAFLPAEKIEKPENKIQENIIPPQKPEEGKILDLSVFLKGVSNFENKMVTVKCKIGSIQESKGEFFIKNDELLANKSKVEIRIQANLKFIVGIVKEETGKFMGLTGTVGKDKISNNYFLSVQGFKKL